MFMVEIGRTVGPLVGPRQRRCGIVLVKPDRGLCSCLDALSNLFEPRSHLLPIIKSCLQGAGNVTDFGAAGKVAGDDDKPAISRGVF